MNDLRRPLPLLLLAIAIVGWVVAIWALSSKSSMERDFRAELGRIEAARDQLSADLQAQREAEGELGELQSAISTAQSDLASASGARAGARYFPSKKATTVLSWPVHDGKASAGDGWPVQMHALRIDQERGAAGMA